MIAWIKRNWLVIILILIIVLNYINRNFFGINLLSTGSFSPSYNSLYDSRSSTESLSLAPSTGSLGARLPYNQVPPTDSPDRIVIQDTSLSLVVKDVSKAISEIETATQNLGGFLVNSHLSRPEQSASGNIVVRIPQARISEALDTFKGYAVKVVSESVNGTDVTDQYVDMEARLEVLNKTKAKFEDIMDQATTVNDLLTVQRELTNLQSQIDNLKGQQKYLEQSANLSRITVYLSTDELSLPYTPDKSWRPAVIFKTAVRSLVGTFRSLGSAVIWLFVYTPVLIPILAIVWFVKRRKKSN